MREARQQRRERFSVPDQVLPLRARASIQEHWLIRRLDTIIGELMQREEVDMWIITGRENNEDPVLLTMLPPSMFHASWFRTILVFCRDKAGSVERLTLTRGSHASELLPIYPNIWDHRHEDEWSCLARLVKERDPERIAVNMSSAWALADGLTCSDHQHLVEALGTAHSERLASDQRLAVGWLERRLSEELSAYDGIVRMAHELIAEAFSSQVIHPGITTAADVVWWFREAVLDGRLTTWFQPSVSLQRCGVQGMLHGNEIILPGDLITCDFGIHYLGLATDTKHQAYVLHRDETQWPAELQELFERGLLLQDLHLQEFNVGRTGNEVLDCSLRAAQARGIAGAVIYTHPLGFHGHAAGSIIGMTGQQQVPAGLGDYPLFDDTCYSVGVEVTGTIAAWGGQTVRLMMEEDIALTGKSPRYLNQRQEEVYLI